MLANVICNCKMASFTALNSITSFLRLKDVQLLVNMCNTVQLLAGFLQCNGVKLEEAEEFKCVSSFIVC